MVQILCHKLPVKRCFLTGKNDIMCSTDIKNRIIGVKPYRRCSVFVLFVLYKTFLIQRRFPFLVIKTKFKNGSGFFMLTF